MSTKTQTEEKATVWLKPEQVDRMRTAAVEHSADYLAARNDALIAVLYDTGLRVSEALGLEVDLLHLSDGYLALPGSIQKDYPNDNTPEYREIGLADDTVRTLRMYLANRWRDPRAVFPSRESDRMTQQSARNVVRSAAVGGEIRPHTIHGRGDPESVTPHTLRHSVAYRMLNREDGYKIYDVKNRLRHATVKTTEQVYSHFDRV